MRPSPISVVSVASPAAVSRLTSKETTRLLSEARGQAIASQADAEGVLSRLPWPLTIRFDVKGLSKADARRLNRMRRTYRIRRRRAFRLMKRANDRDYHRSDVEYVKHTRDIFCQACKVAEQGEAVIRQLEELANELNTQT